MSFTGDAVCFGKESEGAVGGPSSCGGGSETAKGVGPGGAFVSGKKERASGAGAGVGVGGTLEEGAVVEYEGYRRETREGHLLVAVDNDEHEARRANMVLNANQPARAHSKYKLVQTPIAMSEVAGNNDSGVLVSWIH